MKQQQRQKQQRERQAYRWQRVRHAAARVVWSGVAVCAGVAVAAPAQTPAKAVQTSPAVTQSGAGEGVQQLQRFLQAVQQGQARFTQTVAMQRRAAADADATVGRRQKNTVRTSSGTMQFLRPMYLRMEYRQPYRQEIVADGRRIWFYDADLEQVSVRAQNSVAVADTPLAALLTAGSLQELHSGFVIAEGKGAPTPGTPSQQDSKLVWVSLTPKRPDGQLRRLELAFDSSVATAAKPPVLRVLQSHDGFGQVSTLSLEYLSGEAASEAADNTLKAGDFVFTPPPGVAVFEQ